MKKPRWFVIDYATAALGLSLADLLLDGVTGTAWGIAVSAALFSVPLGLAGLAVRLSNRAFATDRGKDFQRALWGVVVLLLPLPLLGAADAALDSFDVVGFVDYVAASLLIYCVSYIPHRLSSRGKRA